MASPYTLNQKGALATVLAAAILTRILLVKVVTHYLTSDEYPMFKWMEFIIWIIIPLYVIRFKWGYIIGIVGAIYVLFVYLSINIWYSGAGQWWTITDPIETIFHSLVHLIAIACIYFSYRSFKELT